MTPQPPSDYSAYTTLTRPELLEKIRQSMSPQRFAHVLRVEEMALELAALYHVSLTKASLAALTHDYAKERPDAEMRALIVAGDYDQELLHFGNAIWHGVVGASLVANELGIHDEDILNAIRCHTTGAIEMSPLVKVIYVADYVERGRDFPVVATARELAFTDLDQAVAFETEQTLLYLIQTKRKIYPRTLDTYNTWVVKK